ncbi:MAG: DUF4190 domain-containing protein [bacterium]
MTGGTGQTSPPGPDQQYGPPGAPGQPPYGAQYGARPPMQQGPKTSGLAIAALVLGILGFCSYGFLGIIGLILGLVAISQINKSEGQTGGKGLAIAGSITGGASLILGVGLIAALVIPNFMKMQAKSKQSEAKTNLGSIFNLETAYFGEHNTYGDSFDLIGWSPAGQNLYTYYIGDQSIGTHPSKGQPHELPAGVEARVEKTSFQAVAVGNIDDDPYLDVWTIDENKSIKNVQNDIIN